MLKKITISATVLIFLALMFVQLGLLDKFIKPAEDRAGEVQESAEVDEENTKSSDNWLIPQGGDTIKTIARVKDNRFHFLSADGYEPAFIFGVNLGTASPGLYPGDLGVSYDVYLRWFKLMADMNVNVVRVYTAQGPQFYSALQDYNKTAEKPIYLIHGIWIDEDDMKTYNDAFAQGSKIMNDLIKDGKDIVDIIHGNATLPARKGYASGNYTSDVSDYVAGWIIGLEWNPYFVLGTNEGNPARNTYKGNYLYTESASPFEAFLCQAGDEITEYETVHYNMQRPLAFSNWVTTDPIPHPNNPHPDEDLVSVNVENIKSQNTYLPGMFASYHAYPYYPDCFNYQQDYISYVDPYGNINPYRKYLHELKLAHKLPIVISELGIPTSRAKAHENIYMGYNQGMVEESAQGEMILSMFQALHEEEYAGGIVFSWQDEWFKHTWNTQMLDLPDRRAYWSDVQTNEQFFGLLAFDPGMEKRVVYADGDVSEWEGAQPVTENDDCRLYVKSDEQYIHLMVETKNFDFENDSLYIPIDTIKNQGSTTYKKENLSFSRGADFVLEIKGKKKSRLLTDAYYDVFYFTYAEQLNMIDINKKYRMNNNGIFNPIKLCINYEMDIPDVPKDEQNVPFSSYETGRFTYGNKNPDHENYNSLADFYYKDGYLEISIPWLMLNVMDPSSKKIIDNFYENHRISPTDADSFWFGIGKENSKNIPFGSYSWNAWEKPTYHERLKKSYYILQKGIVNYLK